MKRVVVIIAVIVVLIGIYTSLQSFKAAKSIVPKIDEPNQPQTQYDQQYEPVAIKKDTSIPIILPEDTAQRKGGGASSHKRTASQNEGGDTFVAAPPAGLAEILRLEDGNNAIIAAAQQVSTSAQQKNDPAIFNLSQRILELELGNTITVILSRLHIMTELQQFNQTQFSEDSSQLSAEFATLLVLIDETKTAAQANTDSELIAHAESLHNLRITPYSLFCAYKRALGSIVQLEGNYKPSTLKHADLLSKRYLVDINGIDEKLRAADSSCIGASHSQTSQLPLTCRAHSSIQATINNINLNNAELQFTPSPFADTSSVEIELSGSMAPPQNLPNLDLMGAWPSLSTYLLRLVIPKNPPPTDTLDVSEELPPEPTPLFTDPSEELPPNPNSISDSPPPQEELPLEPIISNAPSPTGQVIFESASFEDLVTKKDVPALIELISTYTSKDPSQAQIASYSLSYLKQLQSSAISYIAVELRNPPTKSNTVLFEFSANEQSDSLLLFASGGDGWEPYFAQRSSRNVYEIILPIHIRLVVAIPSTIKEGQESFTANSSFSTELCSVIGPEKIKLVTFAPHKKTSKSKLDTRSLKLDSSPSFQLASPPPQIEILRQEAVTAIGSLIEQLGGILSSAGAEPVHSALSQNLQELSLINQELQQQSFNELRNKKTIRHFNKASFELPSVINSMGQASNTIDGAISHAQDAMDTLEQTLESTIVSSLSLTQSDADIEIKSLTYTLADNYDASIMGVSDESVTNWLSVPAIQSDNELEIQADSDIPLNSPMLIALVPKNQPQIAAGAGGEAQVSNIPQILAVFFVLLVCAAAVFEVLHPKIAVKRSKR